MSASMLPGVETEVHLRMYEADPAAGRKLEYRIRVIQLRNRRWCWRVIRKDGSYVAEGVGDFLSASRLIEAVQPMFAALGGELFPVEVKKWPGE